MLLEVSPWGVVAAGGRHHLRSAVAGRSRHEDHVNVQVTRFEASGKLENT